MKKSYTSHSEGKSALFMNDFKVAIVELFRPDIPKRSSLTQRIHKMNKKALLQNVGNRKRAETSLNESIEVKLEPENTLTIATTRAQTRMKDPLDTYENKSSNLNNDIASGLDASVEANLLPKNTKIIDVFSDKGPIRNVNNSLIRRQNKVSNKNADITPNIKLKEKKDFTNIENFASLSPQQKLDLFNETDQDKIEKEHKMIKEAVSKASEHLELDDPSKYRSKSKGFVEMYKSNLPESPKVSYPLKAKLQSQIEKIKQDRESHLKNKAEQEQKLYERNQYANTDTEVGSKWYKKQVAKIEGKREDSKIRDKIGFEPLNTTLELSKS